MIVPWIYNCCNAPAVMVINRQAHLRLWPPLPADLHQAPLTGLMIPSMSRQVPGKCSVGWQVRTIDEQVYATVILGRKGTRALLAREILCWGFPVGKLLMGCRNQFYLPFGSSGITSDTAAALGLLTALGRRWVSWRGSSPENWGWDLEGLGWHQR